MTRPGRAGRVRGYLTCSICDRGEWLQIIWTPGDVESAERSIARAWCRCGARPDQLTCRFEADDVRVSEAVQGVLFAEMSG